MLTVWRTKVDKESMLGKLPELCKRKGLKPEDIIWTPAVVASCEMYVYAILA